MALKGQHEQRGDLKQLKVTFSDRWSREYNRLVHRFRNTIIGQFFGHTHFDEFELFFAPNSGNPGSVTEPTNIAYLAPSQTPHDGLNPAYRIYEIDGVCVCLKTHYYYFPLF